MIPGYWGANCIFEGQIVFTLCPFPDEPADVYQIRCQSVQPFDSFPRLLNLWSLTPPPPEMPPGVLRGDLYLAYVHSQMNPHRREPKLVPIGQLPNTFQLLNPKTPKCHPCVSRGNLFGVYPFPYEFAHVCQIWCQSAQPFGSFSRICAEVSSAFRRCTRWLAQKHAKNNIENYNSGPNMRTSTSLTFFTAIFVALSGALAEELMIFCRHVRTELYIYTSRITRLCPG